MPDPIRIEFAQVRPGTTDKPNCLYVQHVNLPRNSGWAILVAGAAIATALLIGLVHIAQQLEAIALVLAQGGP